MKSRWSQIQSKPAPKPMRWRKGHHEGPRDQMAKVIVEDDLRVLHSSTSIVRPHGKGTLILNEFRFLSLPGHRRRERGVPRSYEHDGEPSFESRGSNLARPKEDRQKDLLRADSDSNSRSRYDSALSMGDISSAAESKYAQGNITRTPHDMIYMLKESRLFHAVAQAAWCSFSGWRAIGPQEPGRLQAPETNRALLSRAGLTGFQFQG